MQNLKKAIAVFILLTTFATTISTVKAQITPEIFVTWPGAVEGVTTYRATSIGQTFETNVNVSNSENVTAWEVYLRFNPSILIVSAYQSGGFLSQFGSAYPVVFNNQSNFGYVSFAETMAGPELASGNGTLIRVTFEVLDGGRSFLDIYDTALLNETLDNISHTTQNGTFILNMLTLTPNSGTAAFIIEGYGFTPDSRITETTWNDEPLATMPGSIETDSQGNFVAISTIPESAIPGSYTVLVRDLSAESANATFTLLSIQGPEGPAGVAGEQGEQGVQGEQGSEGPAAPMEYSLAAIGLSVIAILIAIYMLLKKT